MFFPESEDQDDRQTDSGLLSSAVKYVPTLLGALFPAMRPTDIPLAGLIKPAKTGYPSHDGGDPGGVKFPGDPGYNPDPGFGRVPTNSSGRDIDPGFARPMHGLDSGSENAPPRPKPGPDGNMDYAAGSDAGWGVSERGPARASSFMDPSTGKLDYWGWLAGGANRIGLGGDVLVDDSPDFMERNGIIGKPAAAMAAGNPENAAPPKDVFVESGPNGGTGYTRGMNMAASDTTADGGASGAGTEGGSPPPTEGNEGQGQPPESSDGRLKPDDVAPPVSGDAWRLSPWGQGTAWGKTPPSPDANQKVDPHAYEYPKVPDPKDPKIKELIVSIANKYGVPPELMLIKAYNESGYNQAKVSDQGAVGILQVLPSTAKENDVDPNTLEGNIEAGTRYMRKLLDKANGNPVLAEAGYFGGDGLITNGKPFGPKTMAHVKKLLPGLDDDVVNSRYPSDFASNPYTFWRYMYPYRK